MLNVLEIESLTPSSCNVIIEDTDINEAGAAITRLQSAEARHLALTTATAKGKVTGTVGISGVLANPYPVNSEGKVVSFEMADEQGKPLPPDAVQRQTVAHRIKYGITAR